MQNTRRYTRTSAHRIQDQSSQMIARIGKDQLHALEKKHGVEITPENLYQIFPADFVLDTICPILKNINDKKLINAVVKKTLEKMKNAQHKKSYWKIVQALS